MVSDGHLSMTAWETRVLILVVMEYGLRLRFRSSEKFDIVLILVVMEYGLRL